MLQRTTKINSPKITVDPINITAEIINYVVAQQYSSTTIAELGHKIFKYNYAIYSRVPYIIKHDKTIKIDNELLADIILYKIIDEFHCILLQKDEYADIRLDSSISSKLVGFMNAIKKKGFSRMRFRTQIVELFNEKVISQ